MKITTNKHEINIDLPTLSSEEYLKCKSSEYGWIVDKNYILAFIIDKRAIFKRMVFTDKLITIGNNSIENEQKFLDEMVECVKKQNICDFIAKPQANVFFNVYPKNSDYIKWGTYVTDIQKNDEELLRSFHSKHRNVIRKSIKDGVKIEITKDLDLVYQNIKETLERQNSLFYPSKEYLNCLKNSNLLLLIAKKDDKLQGSAVIVYDSVRGYYMYGGSIPRPHTGSVNLLQYEAMKILRDKGLKKYDFVGARLCVEKGSKFEGIQRFKSRFGAELEEGFAFRIVLKPFKYKLFNFVVKNYLRLKGFYYEDAIDSIKRCK